MPYAINQILDHRSIKWGYKFPIRYSKINWPSPDYFNLIWDGSYWWDSAIKQLRPLKLIRNEYGY